jgi:acyl carrier protein
VGGVGHAGNIVKKLDIAGLIFLYLLFIMTTRLEKGMVMPDLNISIKEVIIKALELEDVAPADIDDSAPLFGEGLGLDSIDALELVIAIKEEFGVSFAQNSEETRKAFASVNALAEYIASRKGEGNG